MTYRKKLIEVALPLEAISAASAYEKSVKNGHPANLHRWWARRPLVAARAVLLASLIDDPSSNTNEFPDVESQDAERRRLFNLLVEVSEWSATSNQQLVYRAIEEVKRSFPEGAPTLIDPFGGGGAIPLEGARLGLNVVTGDLNPVAVLIQRAMLEIPQRFVGLPPIHQERRATELEWQGFRGLADDFRHYARWLVDEGHRRLSSHYETTAPCAQGSKDVVAWIWCRTVPSPDPSWPGQVPLVGSWVLHEKNGQPKAWIEPIVDTATKEISYKIGSQGNPPRGTMNRGKGRCIATGTTISAEFIKESLRLGRGSLSLMAIAIDGPSGREYYAANQIDREIANVPSPRWKPEGVMSSHPQYMGTPRYGIDEWHKLFTDRQLLTLTTLYDMIPELEEKVKSEFDRQIDDERPLRDGGTGAVAYAEAICTYVALALGKLTEMSTSVCRWEPIAQCPRTIFARQSISMLMDFAESNPFGESSGSLNVVIDGIHRVFIAGGLWQPPIGTSKVRQLDAAAQLVDTPSFFVSMDPPYYDNVPYADLSDFFYVWLRPSLKAIWPNEFATVLTPKLEELVADHVRFGGKAEAKQHFEHGLKRVFEEVASRATAEVPTTIFYAFQAREKGVDGTASTGWESFLESLISSGLAITATWPIRTENQSRSRAQGANALATSVVLVCRKRLSGAPLSTRSEFIDSLKRELMPNIRIMRDQNIAPVDLAQSAIGPGISVFSRFARVFESDGSPMTVRSALVAINDVLSEILTGEESDLDSISRFAVTWFDQYGFDNGPYGDGEVAARAKNTAMREVVASGIATSSSGKVRLLKYAELDQGWLPASDTLLTTWEVTHHLLRALQQSESHAAELVRMLGPGLSDRSRQLAYLLYQMSEKHGRRDHAAAYNMLVTAWPQIQRLAAQGEQATGEKGMFE